MPSGPIGVSVLRSNLSWFAGAFFVCALALALGLVADRLGIPWLSTVAFAAMVCGVTVGGAAVLLGLAKVVLRSKGRR